ncbi:sacsin N-terminal ATP-binding-like domain-containing protein [Geodermatophilus sp. SYSU D01180]
MGSTEAFAGTGAPGDGSAAPGRPTFADEVRSWGTGVVHSYLETRHRSDAHRSVKSLIEETATEYGGRFLLELLQNAHDAHLPGTTDGRVLLLLDETEGPHGTVYAADQGRGFDFEAFRAISNLALSSKPVGEGIGNKGVGFKSVLQVCESPEIYSGHPDDLTEDGYCFGFAEESDLREIVPDESLLRCVLADVSRYTVPVPITGVPAAVRRLREEGFSSVLRLPLRSAAASVEARARLAELGTSAVPVVLFLTRIERLSLVRRGHDGTTEQHLVRDVTAVPLPADDLTAERVTVDDGAQFLVLRRTVDPDRLRVTIAAAVQAERLKETWLEWTEPAEIALAVPYGWNSSHHRLYTYLPMGEEAVSPIPGHLHAPFYTDFSRTGIKAEHPLNSMLLDVCGELAVDSAAALLTAAPADADAAGALAAAVTDLVSWSPSHARHLQRNGTPVHAWPVLPGRTGAISISQAVHWPEGAWAVLTPARAEEVAGIRCLRPGLGDPRIRRLRETMAALGHDLDLPAARLAEAVEMMAARCLEETLPVRQWELLYDDLARLFPTEPAARELGGRRLLLAEDGTLQPCLAPSGRGSAAPTGARSPSAGEPGSGRRARRADRAAAFFPPVRQRIEDEDEVDPDVELDPPPVLRKRLFFLHPELVWHDENRQATRARTFLQSHRLVRKFDARSVAEHLRVVLSETSSVIAHREGLRFLFNLQRSRPSGSLPLADSGIRLPSVSGDLVPASGALFSQHWPGTRGADLHAVASAGDVAAELAELSLRLLPDPRALLRSTDDLPTWVAFLRRLGVSDLLPVLEIRDNRPVTGRRLTREVLTTATGLPEDIATGWSAGWAARTRAGSPDTPYRALTALTWLPGQGAVDVLPTAVREAYGRLVIAGLDSWPVSHLETVWERDRPGNKDPQRVPTPLGVFIGSGRWIKVRGAGSSAVEFAAAPHCWHFEGSREAYPPRFAYLVASDLRAALDGMPTALSRLRRAGLGVWNDPADAPRLVGHLADLLAGGGVDPAAVPQLHNAYRTAWRQTLERPGGAARFTADGLVVRITGELSTVPVTALTSQRPVVVTDEGDDEFLRRAAADFGMPVLELDTAADAACARIAERSPGGAVRPGQLGLRILLDGADFEPSVGHPSLLAQVPWLRALLLMVLEHRTPAHERPGEATLRAFAEHTRSLRLATARRVTVRVGSDVRPPPARLRGVLPVPHPTHPTLVLEQAVEQPLSWEALDAATEPLMRLLGHPRLATELKLALLRLSRTGQRAEDELSPALLAEACDIDLDLAQRTISQLGSGVESTLDRLEPVVFHLWGAAAAAALRVPRRPSSDEQLEQQVRAAAVAAGHSADDADRLLLAARRAEDLDEFRRHQGIPLADINEALEALDPPRPRIDYGARHREAFELTVVRHWAGLQDRLRWAHWAEHAARTPVPQWHLLRNRSRLSPDPEWAFHRDELTDSDILAEAERQLVLANGGPLPAGGPALPPAEPTRRDNRDAAERVLTAAGPPLHAWCRRNARSLPAEWSDATDVRPVLEALDRAGALDFRPLRAADVLAWAVAVGAWPADMPATTDLTDLGLTEADLQEQLTDADRERQERQRARRTVRVDGEPIDIGNGYAQLREQLRRSLEDAPGFLASPVRYTRLAPGPTTTRRAGGGGTAGGGGRGAAERASDQQLNAIGFAGEWLAYRWLAERYPHQFTDECWVSANRAQVLPGDRGDDGLGYDFIVPSGGGPVMYEVKSTTEDGGEIRLGESEVLAAQRHARNNRWRLLVITNALSTQRRILQLRNPFAPLSRGMYTFAGQGLRLFYRPDDAAGRR